MLSNQVVTAEQLKILNAREVELFKKRTPKSAAVFSQARDVLLNGVPMPWMSDWGSPHPIYVKSASGNRIADIDQLVKGWDACMSELAAVARKET